MIIDGKEYDIINGFYPSKEYPLGRAKMIREKCIGVSVRVIKRKVLVNLLACEK